MTLKNAAFVALIGTLLLTVLVAVDFIRTVSGVLNNVVPAMALLRSLVYLLASLSVTVFFFVFRRSLGEWMLEPSPSPGMLTVYRAAGERSQAVCAPECGVLAAGVESDTVFRK